MTPLDLFLVGLAGVAAGLINSVVGSGTLITFPTLLALGGPGLTAVSANASNAVGLVFGNASATYALLPELRPQRKRLLRLGVASLLGGTTGALLLLLLPSSAFDVIVPVLVTLGIVLVITQPMLSRRVQALHARKTDPATGETRDPVWVWFAILLAGTYGGYFSAAQGVLVLGILGIGLINQSMSEINAIKNGLVTIVNGIAAIIYISLGRVYWPGAIAIAIGSIIGASIGARVGRKLPAVVYRVIIVIVGVIALAYLLLVHR
ncbi:sulfite exporter TauE/SafE family protein [Granulicoccus phenolivorans]|uniref:sulfite exporter TauE/SafE family protein n=1 Tax=Granulicoccus phenolivorans TaxID=266854 RepID=UPI000407DD18|nr:sulfite exporter TauE/SafE family protein [Granulicoccus phenolivorans]